MTETDRFSLWRRFFDLSPEMLCIAELDGYFKELNPAWEKVLGYTREELIAQPWAEFIHPDDRAATVALAEDLAAGAVIRFENRCRDANGDYKWLEWSGMLNRVHQVFIAAARDISEHKRWMAELREARRTTEQASRIERRFFDLSLELLCVAGFDGYFKKLNPSWERIPGFTKQELKNQPFIEFVHPDDRESTLREAAELAAGGHETIRFDNRYRCRDGSYRWLSWTAWPDLDNQLLMAAARDITEFKQQDAELAHARDAAERANKAKSVFLANMSHELRTPLNSVIGFSNLLLKNRSGVLTGNDLRYLERIAANGKHLLELINDVLDLSKIEAGRMEVTTSEVDLAAVVSNVVDDLGGQAANRQVDLSCEVSDGMRPVIANRQRLKQVLINLTGNAMKFTPASGHVVIRTFVAPRGGEDKEGSKPLRIDVIDEGIGIAADKLERIFEAFRQTDDGIARRYGGTGLGLTISRALCRAMGFELTVSSVQGRGSTFSIMLDRASPPPVHVPLGRARRPLVVPEAAAAGHGSAVPSNASTSPSRSRVLIIDDDAEARLILEQYLSDFGLDVIAVGNAMVGVEVARSVQPALIVLDLQMPEVDGFQTIDLLREHPHTIDIPVAVMSVMASESKNHIVGAVELVDKPVERERLQAIVTRHLSPKHGPTRRQVLIVEDDEDCLEIMASLVREWGFSTIRTRNGEEALNSLCNITPDLILLDIMMPVMDGYELLNVLQRDSRLAKIPVVVVTARQLSANERRWLGERSSKLIPKGPIMATGVQEMLAIIAEKS